MSKHIMCTLVFGFWVIMRRSVCLSADHCHYYYTGIWRFIRISPSVHIAHLE